MQATAPSTERLLGDAQGLVERIYSISAPHPASDFVLSDAPLARLLEGSGARQVDEKLLVQEDADGLALSLFLDAGLLERLESSAPFDTLDADNLDDFWSLIEGVSHFVYLTWNAERAHSVTPLELELQAEVDKFIATALVFMRQRGGTPQALHHWLFECAQPHAGLDAELRERYREANRFAARYCLALERRYMRRRARGLFEELRGFYREDRGGKLARIDVA